MKYLKSLALIVLIMPLLTFTANAQKKTKKMGKDSVQAAAVERLINSKKFTFNAEYAYPAQGGSYYLTTNFYMDVTPGQIGSLLPYYGNATSGFGGTNSGIEFSSNEFDYGSSKAGDGHWAISIKPKDSKDVKEIILNVNPNGTANLAVMSSTKQRMTYSGNIEEKESR